MIPIRKIRNDIFGAFCALSIVGCSLFWVAAAGQTPTPLITPIRLDVATQPAAVVTSTLSPVTPAETTKIILTMIATSTKVNTKILTTPRPSVATTSHHSATKLIVPVPLLHPVPPAPPVIVATTRSDVAYKAKIAILINEATNQFRKDNQLLTLVTDTALARNASTYSETMLARNLLSHTDKKGCDMNCRFTRDGYRASMWGENLAVLHFEDQPTPEYIASYFMDAWKKSPGHRANFLTAAYTHTGIGVAMNGKNVYVTVQFAKPL